jgi:ATP-dependent Clp protease adaptor protein ClpS
LTDLKTSPYFSSERVVSKSLSRPKAGLLNISITRASKSGSGNGNWMKPSGKMQYNKTMNRATESLKAQAHNSNSNDGNSNDNFSQPGHHADVETVHRVDTPKMYKVVLLNDDYTPMDFVILVLKRFFGKTEEEAAKIMLDVHKKGAGIAGVYTLEIAEMRVMQCNQFARMNQHPFKTTVEPE